ncbi:hydrolase [Endozoicomonas sp. SCSIO W0465]|uniref:hydrolase n=1 Tax=Endozoicomonas sp. SCSIO W0465 TaxID=2918516 RepID=UPI002074AE99|nr:hydrolase [Endozoicomonas sp. SCSIO W0465]USE33829.1 hydrolase [Endozoicomonas sp. SCSIO W0465]
MLNLDSTVLVVVDVQGKLATLMHEHQPLLHNIATMVKGAKLLNIPILWLEQIPEKLGGTVPELANELSDVSPVKKTSFSACGEPDFISALEQTGSRQVLLSGIETHICVYQTAMDLLAGGYEVEVLVDAVSSRTLQNKEVALDKMSALGADLTTVEMALFELMKSADAPQFRDVAKLIK